MSALMEYLKTLVSRVRARGPFPSLGPLPFDGDPHAGVRQPRTPSPGGRRSAVALDEPKDVDTTQARGVERTRS